MMQTVIRWIKKEWKSLALLAFLVAVVFANSIPNGFISDDNGITAEAPSWNFQTIFAQPQIFLRSLLYLVLYSLGGLSPVVFRIPNIIFHLLNTWIIFALLGNLVNKKTGIAAAALFAVHPITVESVSWISGGGYAQYAMFFLLALYCYGVAARKNGKILYVFSLFFGALSLVSSDKAIVLPFILALYEIAFGNIRRFWKRLLPFFFPAFGFVVLYASSIGTRLTSLHTTFYQGTSVFRNPLVYFPEALARYVKLIFWPIELSLYHPDQIRTMPALITNSAIAIIYLGITVIAFFRSRVLFFFLSFFLISLSPTLLPVQVTWSVAERYAYLGSIGIIAAVAIVFIRSKFGVSLLIVFLILLSARTISRNADWHDEVSFWTATAKTAPNLPNVHSNLAVALGQKGDYAGAIKEFQTTIALKPDWVDPYYNLALSFQRAGQFASASATYSYTLKLNPNLWQPYRNLAEIAFTEKHYDEAVKFLNQAIEKNPGNATLFVNLALIYQKMDKTKEMRQTLDQALTLDPANRYALQLLGTIGK